MQLSSIELATILELPAEEYWDIGQSYIRFNGISWKRWKRKFSLWALREIAASLDALPEAVHRLASRIQGKEERFLLLPEDARVNLTLFVDQIGGVFGMGLDAETIRLMARINANWDSSWHVRNDTPRPFINHPGRDGCRQKASDQEIKNSGMNPHEAKKWAESMSWYKYYKCRDGRFILQQKDHQGPVVEV